MSIDIYFMYCNNLWIFVRKVYNKVIYTSSVTGSNHSFVSPSLGIENEIWLNQQSLLAPCQCFTPDGISTISPGFKLWASFLYLYT